ncbi:MAG: hypothetical protein AAGK22_02970 [Acidobacteriota bacterium]
MLDRTLQISGAEGVERLASGEAWTPFRLLLEDGRAKSVVWALLADAVRDEPSYEAGVADRLSAVPWFVGSLESLEGQSDTGRGAPLEGVVWHLSRCGSTLARNLLSATSGAVALGEPAVVNQALHLSADSGGGEGAGSLLHGVLGALVPLSTEHRRYYIKASSFALRHIERLVDCRPGLPMIFIHRNPREVLVSLVRKPPAWLQEGVPGFAESRPAPGDDLATRAARILIAFYEVAFAAHERGACRFVDYEQLVERLIDGDLPTYFGYEVDSPTRDRMRAASRLDAKGGRRFGVDSEAKRESFGALDLPRSLCRQLDEHHERASRISMG